MSRKSKKYQYKIVEVGIDNIKLENFSQENSLSNVLMANSMADEILALRKELLSELHSMIWGEYLTSHQKKILLMRLDGMTQSQIADKIGITQSAVHKAMHGNIDYKNNKKRYGGIVKKLKKLCDRNEKVQSILKQIEFVKNNKE